ncbi:AAA family ATPase [Paraburkholderia dilworthii]|uniref:AAA family ATPase n=1 Tax=Paraburkholderia dilworthii TaxID=948106 RepID=UPI0003F88661|nr:AAA family ATPase [Paraburkholderia dilworthii]
MPFEQSHESGTGAADEVDTILDFRGVDSETHALMEYLSKELVVKHAHFQRTALQVLESLDDALPGALIAIVGETRTGKSTLLRALRERQNAVARERGFNIGAVLVEMSVSGAQFDKHDLYSKIHSELGSILPDQKIAYPPLVQGAPTRKELSKKGRDAGLEQAFLKTCKYEPIHLFLDEGNALVGTLGAKAVRRLAESLKYIVNQSNLAVVVAGCPEVRAILSQTDQLQARTVEIELRAYGPSGNDVDDFLDFLVTLEKAIGSRCKEGTLTRNHDAIRALSYGRVGLVMASVCCALGKDNRAGLPTLTWESIHAEALKIFRSLEASAHISFAPAIGDRTERVESHGISSESGGQPAKPVKPFARKPANRTNHPYGR